MATIKTVPKPGIVSEKQAGINVQALEAVGKKFALINGYIERGEEIPSELTKDFVNITLSDDPYKDIE